jgi:23S rRNA maturation-related 3'-5' exoribonuclease YhaM
MMIEYTELKREIDDAEAIIFAIKQSIQYAENEDEYETYLRELAFREATLKELRELVAN